MREKNSNTPPHNSHNTNTGGPPTPGEPPGKEPSHLAGIPLKAKLVVLFLSISIAAASMLGTWLQARDVQKQLSFSEEDVKFFQQFSDKIDRENYDRVATQTNGLFNPNQYVNNKYYFLIHLLNVQAHLKAIINRQSLAIIAVGTAFSLITIGFALFLIGVDGAFQLEMEQENKGKLVFYASTPGLLCFLLAAVLVLYGARTSHELELGDTKLEPADIYALEHQPQTEKTKRQKVSCVHWAEIPSPHPLYSLSVILCIKRDFSCWF